MFCALVLVLAPAGVIAGVASTQASAAVTLPPSLQTIEQQTQQLKVSTERFNTKYALGTPKEGTGFNFGVAYGISGEAVLSPLKAKLSVHVGSRSVPERLIGGNLYVYEPRLSHMDNGKPWVKLENETLQKVIQFDPSGGAVQGAAKEATGAFSYLLSVLNTALSVKEVGPATVDGQSVTEFSAALKPEVLIGVFTKAEYEALDFFSTPTVNMNVYFAASGLPVRTMLQFSVKGIEASATVEILGINESLSVSVPASKLTISKAQRKYISAHGSLPGAKGKKGSKDSKSKKGSK